MARRNFLRAVAVFLILIASAGPSYSYSVLTHEEIVDLLWSAQILPLIHHRFPDLSDEQIKEAHAYAYGGSVIQDLGYYPFGSKQFSDLVHYARSGDFVEELLRQSQNANEYAFALGAMAHYIADVDGHPAVNKAVALRYPKLRAKYGSSVRYAQGKAAHLKIEFGFDTLQVAKSRYAPEQYHDFIGFEVSEPLLERTFPIVYGMDLKQVLAHEDLAIGSYRWAISRLIPRMTKVALEMHKKDQTTEPSNAEKRKFLYHLSRTEYERAWGKTYERPGVGTRLLAAVFMVVPKVGPFRALGFDSPTPQTEDLYIKSINRTFDDYRGLLARAKTDAPTLANRDLDTGDATKAAEYSLADDTYAKWLTGLAQKKFDHTSPQLRANILTYYANAPVPVRTRKNEAQRQKVAAALEQLKATPPAADVASTE